MRYHFTVKQVRVLFIFSGFRVCHSGLVGMPVLSVYQLGPRSWKPDASLSQTVAEQNIEQTCRLSHEILTSEIPESTDDVYHLRQPAGDMDETSDRLACQSNNSNSNEAVGLLTTKPTEDASSTRRSKLTWSTSSGMKQSVASDDNNESVLLLFVVTKCFLYTLTSLS